MRGGASPLNVKVLSVLNVSVFWFQTQLDGAKLNVPPFGASGLA